MKRPFSTAILLLVVLVYPAGALAEISFSLSFDRSQSLPDVLIDGKMTRIHTQGLYVTEKHFYVTGRLEAKEKRALMLRFERSDPRDYEYLDITPEGEGKFGLLDHPGGFDFDGEAFWIPIASSKPRSPSVIVRLEVRADRPLCEQTPRIAFRVDDHIGALAWEPQQRLLYGANWDTKRVYAWRPQSGDVVDEIDHSRLIRSDTDWQLAVQDWKSAHSMGLSMPGVLIVGGVNKSPRRDPQESRAIIELLDPRRRERLARIHVPPPDGFRGSVTNEGLAVHDGHIYLLPADLGRGAKVFRYRFKLRR